MASRTRGSSGSLPGRPRPFRRGTPATARQALQRRTVTPPYKYTVDRAVLELFTGANRRQREKLLRIFDQLAGNPFQEGESLQKDNLGRSLQVKRFGEWTVTYWPEHLGNQIHMIAVEHLRA